MSDVTTYGGGRVEGCGSGSGRGRGDHVVRGLARALVLGAVDPHGGAHAMPIVVE